jgi:cell division protein FtsB
VRRAVQLSLAAVTLAGIVFLFVLPGRIWLAQSRAGATAQRQQAALQRENQALTQEAAQLQSPSYLEEVARAEFGLVMPGEHAYGILPPPATTTTVAPAKAPAAHPATSP